MLASYRVAPSQCGDITAVWNERLQVSDVICKLEHYNYMFCSQAVITHLDHCLTQEPVETGFRKLESCERNTGV